MNSILTNYNAMVALQSLEATQTQLSQVQQQISTGLKINSAKDDAATWAVSTNMNTSVANLQQVATNLGSADSAVGMAVSGTGQLAKLLSQLQTKITSAQDPTTDPNQVQNDVQALLSQVNSTIQSSGYNGLNLLTSKTSVSFLATVNTSADGSSTPNYITVQGANLSTDIGGALAGLNGLSVLSVGDQLFNASDPTQVTAAQKAMGTRQVSATVVPASLGANDTFQVAYTDSTGAARTLNVSLTNTANMSALQLATALNADSGFSSLFNAGVDSTGNLTVSAANRNEETGSFAVGGITDTTTPAGLTAVAATDPATESSMTFQDGVSLQSGQEFTFNFKLNGTTKSVTLQVNTDKSGTVESVDSTGDNITVALNLDSVSGENIKGSDIASAIANTLTGANWFNKDGSNYSTTPASFGLANAAAAGTAVGAAASGATLTFTALDNAGKDEVVSFKPPQTDFQSLLDDVSNAQQAVINASASFGSTQSWIESQQTFVKNLVSTLQNGVGNLVDADMSTESARLTALQVQQQLGTQALAIANQQPQNILALFK